MFSLVLVGLVCLTGFANSMTHFSTCPNNFEDIGGTCYSFSNDQKNWAGARDHCKHTGSLLTRKVGLAELGANPACSNDELLLKKIAEMGWNVWLGASDAASSGSWVWAHSGRSLALANSLWWSDEPHVGGDCLLVGRWGPHARTQLLDATCTTEFHFVCQVFG